MAELKTDYKDQLLDSLVNTKRVYNLVDADGNVVRENVSLEDVTVYSQDGDNFGAADINKTNEMVNQVNRNLGGLEFNVSENKPQWREAGADTWNFFSSGDAQLIFEKLYFNAITSGVYSLSSTIQKDGILEYEIWGVSQRSAVSTCSVKLNTTTLHIGSTANSVPFNIKGNIEVKEGDVLNYTLNGSDGTIGWHAMVGCVR